MTDRPSFFRPESEPSFDRAKLAGLLVEPYTPLVESSPTHSIIVKNVGAMNRQQALDLLKIAAGLKQGTDSEKADGLEVATTFGNNTIEYQSKKGLPILTTEEQIAEVTDERWKIDLRVESSGK
ncbi:MAG TPA: hypothetical protein VLE91_03425 [Candidatus Saccharimonadales bacterium]|nr:hypothetical protein [Candidatus Saccharimonadales bacterium]